MNAITAHTNRPLDFTVHTGQHKHIETYPAGTEINVDATEVEANPNFFNIQIAGTTSNIQTYTDLASITPA